MKTALLIGSGVMGAIILIALMAAVGSVCCIMAINILFDTELAFSIKNLFAVFVLLIFVRGGSALSGSK